MAVSGDYLQYVLEQLAGLGELRSQPMFGAAGLYCAETFFAIVSDDTLYLRVDDSNREDFTARGMAPFRPYADRPQVSMTYYEVPAEVLEDGAALVSWAQRSLAAAARSPPKSKPRRGHTRSRPRAPPARA
jgi:DNA transformation protein and related proteins